MRTVTVIGGGIGGLFTGALLAKNGLKVRVLEKNALIGGGLQCFTRRGKLYETGMHVLGGFRKGQTLSRICEYLGIWDSLHIQHIPSECMDEIRYGATGDIYRIPSGREAFTRYFSSLFPLEAEGVKNYVDEIYRLSEEVPLFYLKEEEGRLVAHSERFMMSADALIASHVKDERLREVLAYLNSLYGGVEGHTPAYVHALINILYINGASRFVGGSLQLAEALEKVINSAGGEVLRNSEVCKIIVEEKTIKEVVTNQGNSFASDIYISAVHPLELVRLLPDGTFLKGFVKRLNEIPVSTSAFSVFLDLKENTVPYIDHTCYFAERYGSMWNQGSVAEEEWPHGFMYMTPPDPLQGKYASRMLVHCVMDFEDVKRWSDTHVGCRGPEYEAWKKDKISKLMQKLERAVPELKGNINNIYAASPLTIRDYFHTKDGAIFGYRKDCTNIMLSQIPIYTKIRNLLLTGQNINLHGICGVPLTAILTAEAVLGSGAILKQLNDITKNHED